jgi:hypothetical protein
MRAGWFHCIILIVVLHILNMFLWGIYLICPSTPCAYQPS